MNKIISEDALRRALSRMSAEQSRTWLVPQLMASGQRALSTPWILDIDTTIKPLYGKQEGTEVSYNPHKPGRPSHALHTYWVGNLRLVLDVVVSPANSPGVTGRRLARAIRAGALEDTLKLSGWDKSRRVVILRRAVKTDLALSRGVGLQLVELVL